MIPSQSVPATPRAFEAFVFAPIGEERNGMTLSVLSALNRLQIDPWEDAAQLSLLSKDSAVAALGQRLALLPRGTGQMLDMTATATRLIELLPNHSAPQPATRLLESAPSTI